MCSEQNSRGPSVEIREWQDMNIAAVQAECNVEGERKAASHTRSYRYLESGSTLVQDKIRTKRRSRGRSRMSRRH